jgi:tetratricopeptide (TPR) repeat protein
MGVVRDLSHYVELSELGVGKPAPTDSDRWIRLNTALGSYVHLLGVLPEDEHLRWHVARLHRMRANLSRFLNKNAEAESSYLESIRLLKQLAAERPENSDYREFGALARLDYSQHLKRFGRHEESARTADDTIRMFEDLLRAQPTEARYVRVVANLLMNRSDREYQVGRWAESELSARRSAELYAKVAAIPGTDIQPFDPLFHAMAEHNLALALREQSRVPEALDAHDRAVDQMAALIKVNKTRDAHSFYHRVLTERAWTRGRDPNSATEAIADLENAISGWDSLIKQFGENPVDLERKGVAGLYSGRLKMQSGQRDKAALDLSAAAKVLEGLVSKQPEIPAYRYSLGRVYAALGNLAATPPEAAELYRKAREMLEAAIQRFPENVPYRQALKELDGLVRKP